MQARERIASAKELDALIVHHGSLQSCVLCHINKQAGRVIGNFRLAPGLIAQAAFV